MTKVIYKRRTMTLDRDNSEIQGIGGGGRAIGFVNRSIRYRRGLQQQGVCRN